MTAKEFIENEALEYKLAEYDEGGLIGINEGLLEQKLEEYHQKQLKLLGITDDRLSFVDWVAENYPTLKNHGDSLTLSELRAAYQQYTNEV